MTLKCKKLSDATLTPIREQWLKETLGQVKDDIEEKLAVKVHPLRRCERTGRTPEGHMYKYTVEGIPYPSGNSVVLGYYDPVEKSLNLSRGTPREVIKHEVGHAVKYLVVKDVGLKTSTNDRLAFTRSYDKWHSSTSSWNRIRALSSRCQENEDEAFACIWSRLAGSSQADSGVSNLRALKPMTEIVKKYVRRPKSR